MKQHSSRFLTLVANSKQRITEITPQALHEKIQKAQPLCIIDIREDNEWSSTPHIPTAIHMGKGIIERDIEKAIPDMSTPIVTYCSGGFRCALVADTLQQMGYTNVSSLETGLTGWLDAGFKVE